MVKGAVFSWRGREYDHNPKDSDWYWSVGIIAVAGMIAAVLFANYLFGLLILAAAAAIALHAAKEPPVHEFALTEQGIYIGERLHPFSDMLSFCVLEDIEGEYPPMISIKTKDWLHPHLIIPLEGVNPDAIYDYFFHHVEEDEHPHSLTDLVAAWLGF